MGFMSFVLAGRGGFFFWHGGGGGFCWQRWWGWVGLCLAWWW